MVPDTVPCAVLGAVPGANVEPGIRLDKVPGTVPGIVRQPVPGTVWNRVAGIHA